MHLTEFVWGTSFLEEKIWEENDELAAVALPSLEDRILCPSSCSVRAPCRSTAVSMRP